MSPRRRPPVDRHRFALKYEDGAMCVTVDCPYNPADQRRPCWPNVEAEVGWVPAPAPRLECAYRGWIDNTDYGEILHGTATFPLHVRPEWPDGDYLTLRLLVPPAQTTNQIRWYEILGLRDLLARVADACQAMKVDGPDYTDIDKILDNVAEVLAEIPL